MNNLHELPNPWESFQQGEPEAFRYYFLLHNYRIYCYLLYLSKDQAQSKELTQNVFVALFRNKDVIKDQEHLLRRLYLSARVRYFLRLKGRRFPDLEEKLVYYVEDDENIMEDPDIARNETLLAVQDAMQKLPPAKREVAELYFFQGFSTAAIARHLGLDEQSVREIISQSMKRLGEDLLGKGPMTNELSLVRA
ncbi:MAG TPA: sigma-70 family RNA polymerase sigma factor [Puia sp.]|nr:sigma-70 family RNA polymerase sigma factor [Puia sp.]